MILGGRNGAPGGSRTWVIVTLVLSLVALMSGVVVVLLMSQFYVSPHVASDDFIQTQCYVRSIEILHIKKEGRVTAFHRPNCTKGDKVAKNKVRFSGSPPTTLVPPGLYPTKPSSIFTRNYDNIYHSNKRNFPETGHKRSSVPSNIYRTNGWDPFEDIYGNHQYNQNHHRRRHHQHHQYHRAVAAPQKQQQDPPPPDSPSRHRRTAQPPTGGKSAAGVGPSPTARPQQGAKDCSKGYVEAGMLCVHMSVLFRGVDGYVALGTLYADRRSLPTENHTSTLWPTKKCICDGCEITAISGNGSSVDEVMVGKTKIRQGTRTRCYYPMNGGNHLLISRTSRHISLHAILWPTAVIVSGFVGVLVSCIVLQRQRQQRRKQETIRPSRAYV